MEKDHLNLHQDNLLKAKDKIVRKREKIKMMMMTLFLKNILRLRKRNQTDLIGANDFQDLQLLFKKKSRKK